MILRILSVNDNDQALFLGNKIIKTAGVCDDTSLLEDIGNNLARALNTTLLKSDMSIDEDWDWDTISEYVSHSFLPPLCTELFEEYNQTPCSTKSNTVWVVGSENPNHNEFEWFYTDGDAKKHFDDLCEMFNARPSNSCIYLFPLLSKSYYEFLPVVRKQKISADIDEFMTSLEAKSEISNHASFKSYGLSFETVMNLRARI